MTIQDIIITKVISFCEIVKISLSPDGLHVSMDVRDGRWAAWALGAAGGRVYSVPRDHSRTPKMNFRLNVDQPRCKLAPGEI